MEMMVSKKMVGDGGITLVRHTSPHTGVDYYVGADSACTSTYPESGEDAYVAVHAYILDATVAARRARLRARDWCYPSGDIITIIDGAPVALIEIGMMGTLGVGQDAIDPYGSAISDMIDIDSSDDAWWIGGIMRAAYIAARDEQDSAYADAVAQAVGYAHAGDMIRTVYGDITLGDDGVLVGEDDCEYISARDFTVYARARAWRRSRGIA
jgi:hypothetical protein